MIEYRSSASEEIHLLQFKHDLLEKIYAEVGNLICKLTLQDKYEILKEIVEELEKGRPHYPSFYPDLVGYESNMRAIVKRG
jgi:chaperonin cofactor prefoldin